MILCSKCESKNVIGFVVIEYDQDFINGTGIKIGHKYEFRCKDHIDADD